MRCQVLDGDGCRCGRTAVYVERRHGLNEYETDWYVIFVCGHHSEKNQESEWYIGKGKDIGWGISPHSIWEHKNSEDKDDRV